MSCSQCVFASNVEKAKALLPPKAASEQALPIRTRDWFHSIPLFAATLDGIAVSRPAAAKVLQVSGEGIAGTLYIVAIVPLGREINFLKLVKNGLGSGAPQYVQTAPVVLDRDSVVVFVDANLGPALAGNAVDQRGWKQIDLIDAQHGDSCPSCLDGTLRKKTAIEVAHTFYLGKKYSVSMVFSSFFPKRLWSKPRRFLACRP